jgi:hypothetical protein
MRQVRTVLFAHGKFACNIKGRKYNYGDQIDDLKNLLCLLINDLNEEMPPRALCACGRAARRPRQRANAPAAVSRAR